MLRVAESYPDMFRCVAIVPLFAPDEAIRELHRKNVRGIRINLKNPGELTFDDARAFARRLARFGWHIQLQFNSALGYDLASFAASSPVPLVLDHFGLPDIRLGPKSKEFSAILKAVETGKLWVKLSGPYRVTHDGERPGEITPFARALVAVRPDRLLWASDWPHTELWNAMPDDADLVDMLVDWLPALELNIRFSLRTRRPCIGMTESAH